MIDTGFQLLADDFPELWHLSGGTRWLFIGLQAKLVRIELYGRLKVWQRYKDREQQQISGHHTM